MKTFSQIIGRESNDRKNNAFTEKKFYYTKLKI